MAMTTAATLLLVLLGLHSPGGAAPPSSVVLGTGAPVVRFPGPAACTDDPAFSLLDFWVGEWEVRVEGRIVGHNRIEKSLADCAIFEHWTDARGTEGKSLFYYDTVEETWKQVWVTENATRPGGMKEKEMVERFEDGGVRFQGTVVDPETGRSWLDRTTLRPLDGGRVRQHIEISRDGGESWESTFDAVYLPVTGPGESPSGTDCDAEFGDPADSDYILPFPEGRTYRLIQGNCPPDPDWGHHGWFAYDFDLQTGDTVVASRPGRVRFVREDQPDVGGRCGVNGENIVIVQHDDGSVMHYVHFTTDGALVEVGDRVERAQPIGLSGNSGCSSGPHLHVVLFRDSTDYGKGAALPLNYRNAVGPLDPKGGLIGGRDYTAGPPRSSRKLPIASAISPGRSSWM